MMLVGQQIGTDDGLRHVDWGFELLVPLDDLLDDLGIELLPVHNFINLKVTYGLKHRVADLNSFHGLFSGVSF